MKYEELKQALRLITKVQTDPRLRPDQGNQLLKAKRELEEVARSGKLEKRRIFLAVQIITTILLEIVEANDPTSE
jgi:hypothetical protein